METDDLQAQLSHLHQLITDEEQKRNQQKVWICCICSIFIITALLCLSADGILLPAQTSVQQHIDPQLYFIWICWNLLPVSFNNMNTMKIHPYCVNSKQYTLRQAY